MNLRNRVRALEHAGGAGRYIVVERLPPSDVEPLPNGRVYARHDEPIVAALVRCGYSAGAVDRTILVARQPTVTKDIFCAD